MRKVITIILLVFSVIILSGCDNTANNIMGNKNIDQYKNKKYIEIYDFRFEDCDYTFDKKDDTKDVKIHIFSKKSSDDIIKILKGKDKLNNKNLTFFKTVADGGSFSKVVDNNITGYTFNLSPYFCFIFNSTKNYYEIECTNEEDFNKIIKSLEFK